MLAVLLILVLAAGSASLARSAPAVPSRSADSEPRSDLIVLRLSPQAAAAVWRGDASPSGLRASRRVTGRAPLERAAAELGGVWLEPQFPADGPQRDGHLPALGEFWLAHLPEGIDPERARAKLASVAGVASATHSQLGTVSAVPDDSLWSVSRYFYQPTRRDIHAPEAWDVTTGDTSIVVAIIDTGVLPYHPDLGVREGAASQLWTNTAERDGLAGIDDDGNGYIDDAHGWDFVQHTSSAGVVAGEDWSDADNDPNDFAGHGTAIAGVIGAHSDNGIGVTGTAWRVRLMPLRIGWAATTFPLGLIDAAYAAQAIRYATRMGATVINCSFAVQYQADLFAALEDARDAGITVVAAAGGAGSSLHYIADREEVIAVTATDDRDRIPAFTNRGAFVDVAAPGANLRSTSVKHVTADSIGQRQCTYWDVSGASFSCALASGVVALYHAHRLAVGLPRAGPFETQMRLVETTDDISEVNPTVTGYGSGRLNALRVLTDPPTSTVMLPDATMSGPAVGLPPSSPVRGAAVALADGRIAMLDLASTRVFRTISLSAPPVGGIAAAALGGNRGFGMFVATTDGSISGFNEEGEPLPGFPVAATAGNSPGAMPALGDLDGDGGLEVVWGGSDGKVWAWTFDGRFVSGFPRDLEAPGSNVQIALSDLDDEPGVEIVAVTAAGSVYVMNAGGVMPGWPQDTGPDAFAPTITRLAAGEAPSILIAAGGATLAFAPDGTQRWRYSQVSTAHSEPVPGDLNGDGVDEVIVSRTRTTELFVLGGTGQPARFGSWPKRYTVVPHGTPLIGHVSPAGTPAVLWTLPESGVYAYDSTTAILRGFPKPGRAAWAGSIGDFDGDGRTEILGGVADGPGVFVYRLGPGTWRTAPQQWPTPRGNFARTGSRLYAPGLDEDTPVLVSLVTARAEPGVVHLAWRSAGDRFSEAVLERRLARGAWSPIATLIPDARSDLRHEDRGVHSGEHYGYRLAVTVNGRTAYFGELEIDVPFANRLELAGARPNPASFGLRVAFELPTAAAARLDVIDLAGRRCWSSEVGSLGPGNHVLAVPARLAPGIYTLRLAQGAAELRARCVVLQ